MVLAHVFKRIKVVYVSWQDMPYAFMLGICIRGRKHIKPFNVHFIDEKKNNPFRVCFFFSSSFLQYASNTGQNLFDSNEVCAAIRCSSSLALMYYAICLMFGCIAIRNTFIFASEFFSAAYSMIIIIWIDKVMHGMLNVNIYENVHVISWSL